VLGVEAGIEAARRDRELGDVVPAPTHRDARAETVRAVLLDGVDDIARVVLDALAHEDVDDLVHLDVDEAPTLEDLRILVVEDVANVVQAQEHAAGRRWVDAQHERAHVVDELDEDGVRLGARMLDQSRADVIREVEQRRHLEGERERGDGEHALEVERRPEHECGVGVGTRVVEAGDCGDELGAVAHALGAHDDVEEVGGEHAENAHDVLRRILGSVLLLELLEVQ